MMKLLELLQEREQLEESYFQKALLREDLSRLESLREKACQHQDVQSFLKDALYIGWTKGDLRTGELKEVLHPLMRAIYAHAHPPEQTKEQAQENPDPQAEKHIIQCWSDFAKERMKVLIHCL